MTGDNLALTSDGLKYTPVAEGEDADGDQVMQAQPYGRKRLQAINALYVRPSLFFTSKSMVIASSEIDYHCCKTGNTRGLLAVGRKIWPSQICEGYVSLAIGNTRN